MPYGLQNLDPVTLLAGAVSKTLVLLQESKTPYKIPLELECSASFDQILENALLSMKFESRALLWCLLSIKYVTNAFSMHFCGLKSSKHTPGAGSPNLVAEAQKCYENCYAWSFRLILQVKCFRKMSKSQILQHKTFVTRDMAIQWMEICETFFSHGTW